MKLRVVIILILFTGLVNLPVAAQKSAKKIVISGKVVDSNQNPLAGVTILIDNRNVNCETDQKGCYKIRVSPAAKYLTAFSMTNGMKDIPINGKAVINVELYAEGASPIIEKANAKEETVDVGYGSLNKKEITTHVSKIEVQNPRFASYTNIYDLLRSQVPGIRINGKTIYLVEPASLNGSNEPLIVVDGSQVTNIDDIEPSMVKSIEVLKGASASIYGTRGSNGVILINLLRGVKKN
jgi:TonB-dependent SusC/RagA subfamily outer membrane receptor